MKSLKIYLISLLSLIFLIVFPEFASADTIVSSPIASDTTWSPSGGVYIINSSFSVTAGATLTIEPGTIIKARTTSSGGPSIYGKLIAHGTIDSPIYLTSIYDDSLAGDTGGDGVSSATPGSWQGLYFKSGSAGTLDHVNLSYAGYGGSGYGNFVGIENDGGDLDIKNSNIHHNGNTGIRNINGSLSIQNSTISNNIYGISVQSGTTTVSNSIIKDNSSEGLNASGEGSLILLANTFSGNLSTAYIDASKIFAHSNNTSSDLSNRGFIITGNVSDGTLLHSSDLPIIVNGSITVESGKTLTIAPGTILKMGSYPSFGSIIVYGKLISKGTANNKIYFTSIYDDSIGGDTNGDGNNTIAKAKDWNAIFLENNSVADFDNTVIRYSGYNYNGEYIPGVAAALYNRGSNLNILNSFLGYNNGAAIFQDAGTSTISKSEILQNAYGLQSRGGSLGISESSLHGNIDQAIYNQNGPTIDAKNNWWGSSSGPHDINTPNPTGSGDRLSGDVLYIPFLTSDPSLIPVKPDPVIIVPGIMGSAYKNGVLVIDPILHTYDDLIATLDANGYTPGVDLFAFPYEWRDSNTLTANLLKNTIDKVKVICNCSKVDLVAHSMGGLVSRQYIQSSGYDHDVDQIIFLGTPHKGSPTDYLQWEAGKFPPDINNILRESFFLAESLRNGYLTIFDYIHDKPILSVQELLPVFDYLKDKNGVVRTYPNNYPQNFFLQSLNSNISNLLNSGVKVTNIVGDSGENKTINVIRVIPTDHQKFWQHGEPDGFSSVVGDNGLERGIGDNTVPKTSSVLNGIVSEEISASHNRIPTKAANKIVKILTGKDSATNIDNGTDIDPKVLVLQLLSPVDFVITAPNGKKIGKNFSNGTEYDEIPGAFYSGYQTEEEYITILNPLDGEYKVELKGTGSGKYTVLTSYVSEATSTTVQIVGTTTLNQINNVNVEINNSNPSDISIDPDLIGDINKSYEIGWIKDKKIKDQLLKKAEAIIKFEKKIVTIEEKLPNGKKKQKRIDRLEKRIDKKAASALLLDLKGYNKDKITLEGYNLLKGDLDWIINH